VMMRNHGKLGRLEREKVWLTDAGRQLEMGVEAVQQNETARDGEHGVVRGVCETVRAAERCGEGTPSWTCAGVAAQGCRCLPASCLARPRQTPATLTAGSQYWTSRRPTLIEAAWRAWRGSRCADVESRKRRANDQLIPSSHDQGLFSIVPARTVCERYRLMCKGAPGSPLHNVKHDLARVELWQRHADHKQDCDALIPTREHGRGCRASPAHACRHQRPR
jgi:hypothetical protein